MTPMATVAGWHRVLDRLRALGDGIVDDPLDPSAAGAVERLEHLVDQVVVWMGWEVLHADPTRPFFHRHNDLTSQWGGPNADNVYRHCRIAADRRYVVRGRMHSCAEFLLAVRAGFMHRETWGTLNQVTATEHGIRPGQDFELLFVPEADLDAHPGAIALPAGAIMLSVREYYFDWNAEEPATFTVECLDPEPPVPLTETEFERRLGEAIDEIEESVGYWNAYLADNRSERADNSFARTTVKVGKGLSVARYEFCFWDLAADEALIIECEQPAARYWSAMLYRMHTFELVDPWASITSRNQTQVTPSSDGLVRFVLAASDPGAPNWLDTRGRRHGLCTVRWFWPAGDQQPAMATRVVACDDVAAALAPGDALVTPDRRATELADRQAHLRWRFRT